LRGWRAATAASSIGLIPAAPSGIDRVRFYAGNCSRLQLSVLAISALRIAACAARALLAEIRVLNDALFCW